MFSIAAINDADSRGQWEPLAPTKEAQEFHLSQTYHEGLLKLQAKEYEKARELLESVLRDPLISSAQVDSSGSDGHLLQLSFLTLKNLATVFLQQGSNHYESALRCYLQAVEIDTKDSVVWNQLGTLSCSMGLLSISRWAFEQGLFCSPNNWNCMEKLLEVLIAIGDEVACLSVAELILRHWPSHSRALYVKNTIEETEPIPFAPKGIDKLEPKHVRLKFLDKRKATDKNIDKSTASKKLNQNIELHLPEASWTALANALLGIFSKEGAEKLYRSSDIRLSIRLPNSSENIVGPTGTSTGEEMSLSDCNSEKANSFREKEVNVSEEQPQERRSSRLRSRKPGKEELDFAPGKDQAKVVTRFLRPFIVDGSGGRVFNDDVNCSVPCVEAMGNPLDTEIGDITRFVGETSRNFGAYHMGHLLLEEVANRSIFYYDAFSKFLELEKLTRQWGQDRTPECSLFLAELYYDFGTRSSDMSKLSEFMSEASYHLCKIIESVALDYPFRDKIPSLADSSAQNSDISTGTGNIIINKRSFWVRFFWVSGRLSILDRNKAKAQEELSICLSLLTNKENINDPLGSVRLPHCKVIQELTEDTVLHEISLLELDFLLMKTVGDMIEKDMYSECISLLVPLLFSTKEVHLNMSCLADKEGQEGVGSVELLALDALIKACEMVRPIDAEVYWNCHQRKLQILMVAAGLKALSGSETEVKEDPSKHWNHLVAEEVKAISQLASQTKNFIDPSRNFNAVPVRIIGGIQSLLLAIMYNIASIYFSKKTSGLAVPDQTEQSQKCCFIDASIAFCKLQHLNPSVPVKIQIELIVAVHNLLAEYGLCCAGGDGEEEEGPFLKLAIKHLLALHMKLKSNSHSHSPSKGMETTPCEASTSGKDAYQGKPSINISSHEAVERENIELECGKNGANKTDGIFHEEENTTTQFTECGNELTEDEKEELELSIDNALNQCFFCLYGLNLRSDSSYEDELSLHKNASRGDYQTKEQCADVFQYILPYAKASSKTGLLKLRRVLRAIRKHFPHPPDNVLAGNVIDKFLDDPDLCEDKLSDEAGSDGFLDSIMKIMFPNGGSVKQLNISGSSDPYLEVYCNLYYLLAQSEEMSATDKWAGFVLTKEGEEFVEQNAKLFKYDLLYNPLRFESWQRLANIYDEEVDLLLNDGSKQINVASWRKNGTLPQRVEASRRRSRRCLLMTLALAKTSFQQGEIHELLALVYYDGLQNVVPFYDQRSVVPSKDAVWIMFCQNSMRHFKKAFAHKEDWSYAFYLGKLSEKLGYSYEISLSHYDKAINLNPSAVDPVYRMHASRLKLLCACGKQNEETLKIVAAYSFCQSTKEIVMNTFSRTSSEMPNLSMTIEDEGTQATLEDGKLADSRELEDVWQMLYSDCLAALEICVEGDLKHFHKARYMLAQSLYRRGGSGDLERAKEELSFCFKSSRSSFTINMWEIDSMVKKGRRKTPGLSGNRKALEVNLAESSRKFITCIRKYMLLYLKLLEETGDMCTLDRAYISIRVDKRFSLCLEDLVPVALGRYIKALISSIRHTEIVGSSAPGSSLEYLLEKMFSLFLEQMNLWSDICNLPEIKNPELSEGILYGYLYQYIQSLETNVRLETLEGINEKIRKRFKNPKLSNSNCAKVYRHISVAWWRSLVISLALITPLDSGSISVIEVPNQSDSGSENTQLLCVDLQTSDLWNSSFEDPIHLKNLETKWSALLSRIKNIIIKKASEEDLDTATSLLRSSYNFFRDTSSVTLPSFVEVYLVPSQFASEVSFHPGMDGVHILDLSIPRKLLLWAYTLLHGRCTNMTVVLKYCEEIAKSKTKKGSGSSSMPSTTPTPTATSHTGGGIDGVKSCEAEAIPSTTVASSSALPESEVASKVASAPLPESESVRNIAAALLESEVGAQNLVPTALPIGESTGDTTAAAVESVMILSDTPHHLQCKRTHTDLSNMDEQNGTDTGEC